MTSYELIKGFYAKVGELEDMQARCKTQHLALFTWITELHNRTSRVVLDLPREYTMAMSFIGSASTFKAAVEDLAAWGLIEILQQGNNQHKPTKIKVVACINSYRHDTGEVPAEYQQDTDTIPAVTITKTSKTDETSKTNIDTPKTGKAKDVAVSLTFPPFAGEAFATAWNTLLQGKKWKSKGANALQITLNKLTGFDERFAVDLICTAIEKDWAGLVYESTPAQWQQYQANKAYQPPANQPPATTYQDLMKPEFRDAPVKQPAFQFKSSVQ